MYWNQKGCINHQPYLHFKRHTIKLGKYSRWINTFQGINNFIVILIVSCWLAAPSNISDLLTRASLQTDTIPLIHCTPHPAWFIVRKEEVSCIHIKNYLFITRTENRDSFGKEHCAILHQISSLQYLIVILAKYRRQDNSNVLRCPSTESTVLIIRW